MKLEGSRDREHGAVDLIVLLAAVCLALATWSYLANVPGLPIWKPYSGVAVTGVLALASLTRNLQWAIAIRFLTGAWLLAAPYLLSFEDIDQALRTYLAAGLVVATSGIPGIAARCAFRLRPAT